MPRYDIRNDGVGPYCVFYCDTCGREFRSQPNIASTVTQDLGRQALGGLLRKVPLVGGDLAENVLGEDARYSYKMTPPQIEQAWKQAQEHFRECPTCLRIVCLSDFDVQSGFCQEDSPRTEEISEARGAQAGAALKGFANAFGLGDALKGVENAVNQAQAGLVTCPQCGTNAAAGTKFCPECGAPMSQPAAGKCPQCGAAVGAAKFCPECGARVEQARSTVCPNCGVDGKGARFCPECGTKIL
jgi:DNA-directed RNA polymerase subunit M/transcription elongation factor TFIIS